MKCIAHILDPREDLGRPDPEAAEVLLEHESYESGILLIEHRGQEGRACPDHRHVPVNQVWTRLREKFPEPHQVPGGEGGGL